MQKRPDLSTTGVVLDFATIDDMREATKLQLRARVFNGLNLKISDALLWLGVLTYEEYSGLLRGFSGGPTELARDRCGKLHFGDVAVAKGLITEEQFSECRRIQSAEGLGGGSQRLVAEILFERKLLTHEQVEEVITTLCDSAYPDRRKRGSARSASATPAYPAYR